MNVGIERMETSNVEQNILQFIHHQVGVVVSIGNELVGS